MGWRLRVISKCFRQLRVLFATDLLMTRSDCLSEKYPLMVCPFEMRKGSGNPVGAGMLEVVGTGVSGGQYGVDDAVLSL